MKTFKQLIAEVAEPNNEDELNFKAKHAIELITFPPADETAYSGGTKKSPPRRADYVEGEDEDVYEAKKLDPVGKADADIDNDGDTDKSDEYLHARRKAIAKAMKEAIEKKLDPVGKADADIDNDGDTDKSDEYLHARRKAIAKSMKKEAAQSPYAIGMASAMKATGDKPPLKKSTIMKAHKIAKAVEKNESVQIDEANASKIIAGLNAGDSVDVIVQNNLNKKGDNKDEILKVIRDYNWKKRMKKESANKIDEATPTKKEITTALQSIKAQPKEKVTLKKAPWNEKKEEVSLDEAVAGPQDCWPGYRKVGTKMGTGRNAGKRVNDCQKISEASYSAKAAAAGKDIGKPGKEFEKIAKDAGERYGSEERGKKVAGAILAKLRAKNEEKEVNLDESFKAGIVKLNDGSSVIIKEADAKLLNQLVSELADKNREAMMKTAMKDKKGFNEILGFAKEAL